MKFGPEDEFCPQFHLQCRISSSGAECGLPGRISVSGPNLVFRGRIWIEFPLRGRFGAELRLQGPNFVFRDEIRLQGPNFVFSAEFRLRGRTSRLRGQMSSSNLVFGFRLRPPPRKRGPSFAGQCAKERSDASTCSCLKSHEGL